MEFQRLINSSNGGLFRRAARTIVEDTPWRNTLQGAALSIMDIREVLALNLRKLRRARRFSQEELAHRAKVDRTYVSSLERRVYSATIDILDRLAHVLGVEAADLLRRPPAQSNERKRARSSSNN